jgi:putative FmdB family regulatory protein
MEESRFPGPNRPAREATTACPGASLTVVPTYEYRCPRGHVFERFQRISDPPPEACEVCGEGPVTTVLYPVPVHFKGSGFYSTDYGRGSRKKEGDDAKTADSSDGAKPDKKDEPKKEKASS